MVLHEGAVESRLSNVDHLKSMTRAILPVVSCIALAFCIGVLSNLPSAIRLGFAAVLATTAAALAIRAPKIVVYALPIWLVALGTVRRITTGLSGTGVKIDPLLAVEPLILVTLTFLALRNGALRRSTPLTKAVLALGFLLTVSALNPLQGSIRVGLTGAVIVVSPMLAFLIGRWLMTDQVLTRLLKLVAGLAVPAGAYGLYQVFAHFPSWDQRWIQQQQFSFQALYIGGVVRPFGSFASGQEFGLFAAIGLVIILAFTRRSRWVLMFAPVVLLALAIWYESSRTIVVFVVFTAALAGATRLGWPIRRSILAGLFLLATLPWLVGHVLPARFSGATGTLQSHQTAGLRNPLGNQSTLPIHFNLLTGGFRQAIAAPLGLGVGSVTEAAGKFGTTSAGTEVDPGNAAVAAGVPGLIAYLVAVGIALARASDRALARRDALSIAALSVLAVTLTQWLNGGLYSVGWLPWLVLGWVDRPLPIMIRAEVKKSIDA